MAKLFISLSGEGRGHASRVAALTEHLRQEHDVAIFAPGLAYELLDSSPHRRCFSLERIDGLLNRYRNDGSWDYGATLRAFSRYYELMPRLVSRLSDRIRADRPDLVITDFEPALPRAAERHDVPYISINHQHFMVVNDLSSLPLSLRLAAGMMGLGVRTLYRNQVKTIVSSFFSLPLKPQYSDVLQIGVILRQEVARALPKPGNHLVAYIRRDAPPNILEALRAIDAPAIVYGLGRRRPNENLVFKAIDAQQFVDDLASSRALMCTAGNQIVGEALYLGKPVFVMPEPGNYEQSINAHFVRQMNVGAAAPLQHVSEARLRDFLRQVHCFFPRNFEPNQLDGAPAALRAIEAQLGRTGAITARRPAHEPSEVRVA